MKTKDANRYICDGCGAEIVGRKAYDILQKAKYGKGLRGFCSMHCYHSSIKLDEKQCEQCSKVFTPKDITQKYCCHSCSAKSSNKNRNYDFLNSYKYGECIECKEKTHVRSSTNIFNLKCKNCKVKDGKKHIYDGKVITISECRLCSNKYSYTSRGSRFCSDQCRDRFIKEQASLSEYRRMCQFKFSMKKFPTEFEFDLIKKHGWYSPANKKNNLSGVSRDHMVSVRYGFEHKIDPELISHPANCKLMIHNENISKNNDCSISLEELKERIKIWNLKYPNTLV